MNNLNPVTIILAAMIVLPILTGSCMQFTREKIQYSFGTLFDNIEFLIGLVLSIYFTKRIFFEHDSGVYSQIYLWIPNTIKSALYGKDVATYIIVVPFILLVVLFLLRIITSPIYRYILIPLSEKLYKAVCSLGKVAKSIAGALWQIPKSIYLPIIFALLLNFYSYYFYSPVLTKWMNQSQIYQFVYNNALYPVLNSNIAKQIPVLVNDSFRDVFGKTVIDEAGSISDRIVNKLSGYNIKIIEYFNGVTLEEAIKSTPEIDETAKGIVGKETNSSKKAYLIYKWISKNMKYDYEKAEKIVDNPKEFSSGSIVAFNTKKGICFDYSSLYVSMCRAVGLKVRLITGLGYSGVSWGDHAWNQVYCSEEQRWINVDATFGSSGINYFDKRDFYVDHRDDVVQGDW